LHCAFFWFSSFLLLLLLFIKCGKGTGKQKTRAAALQSPSARFKPFGVKPFIFLAPTSKGEPRRPNILIYVRRCLKRKKGAVRALLTVIKLHGLFWCIVVCSAHNIFFAVLSMSQEAARYFLPGFP
jgi:hypothetical protein